MHKRSESVTRRIVLTLALLPVVPAVSVVGAITIPTPGPGAAFDEIRWFQLLFSFLWVAGTITIWRQAVVWTLGRSGLTAMVSLIPFVQVMWNAPLWSAGCIGDEFLRVGQQQVSAGTWIWLVIWIWWGWEKMKMSTMGEQVRAQLRMTVTAKRLVASVGMIPVVFGVFLIGVVLFEKPLGITYPMSMSVTYLCTAGLAVICWLLIWRKAVVWTGTTTAATTGFALLLLVLPIAATFLFPPRSSGVKEMVLYSLPVIGWGLWMSLTVWYWPRRNETSSFDPSGPRCPDCDYSLRGLRATRCPECGSEPTLDELWQGAREVD